MGQPRELEESAKVFEDRFLGVRRDRFGGGSGPVKHALVLELPDWVNVVAFDDEERIVLVRQFRFGTREVNLEIPGGGVDDGESARIAAERELREETGLAARDWVEIGTVEPNPAIQGNRCTTFLARGLTRIADYDADEIDEVTRLPWREIPEAIGDGRIRHALVIAAVYFAQVHLASR